MFRTVNNVFHTHDGTIGAAVERSIAVLRVVGSIPARNKYLHELHSVVPGQAVCVCVFLDTGIITRVNNVH